MTTHQIAQLLLALAAIIVLSRVLGMLAVRLGQPPVIGELTAGILIGPTFLAPGVTAVIFPADLGAPLAALANIGLVLFMFCVGLEMDRKLMRGRGRIAASVSVGSILLPFGLAVLLALWLVDNHDVADPFPFVLFLGAAMSVTAFPVLARILTDRKMTRTEVGGLALASAAFDDVVAWSLLALVVAVAGAGADGQWYVVLAVPYVLLMLLVVRPMLRRVLVQGGVPRPLSPTVMAAVLVGLLASSWATEAMGIHFIFGAFLFGAIMPHEGFDEWRSTVLDRIEPVNGMFLLPVFFVLSGMRVDLSALDARAVVELVLILIVAVTGKFVGAYLCARVLGVAARPAGALATLMNTRGLTEIVFLTVGLQFGIIDHELFSMMVVMALFTTAMAAPLLRWIYPPSMYARDGAPRPGTEALARTA